MKTKIIFFSILLGLFSSNVYSAQLPKSSSLDNRMQVQNFNASDVTIIKAKNGFATAVTFSQDEKIIDIAVGFNGWEVNDNNNVIYIKPVALGDSDSAIEPRLKEWDTNLIITTNKRQYAFDLVLVADDSKDHAYLVKFNYPHEEAQAKAEKLARANKEKEQNKLNAELNSFTVPRNWDFYMRVGKNSRSIAPAFAYDDGIRTYLGFDNVASIPAVFYYQGEEEMMSNTTQKTQGKYTVIIVQKVAERFILRSGDQVIGVINRGYGKNKSNETTTSSESIERVLK